VPNTWCACVSSDCTVRDFLLHPLAQLAARAPDAVIGRAGAQAVTRDAFLTRVADWSALAAGTHGRHCALYIEDSIEFAAALLALWQCGKTVWLSADTLPATCTALAASVDDFYGEFPAPWQGLQAGAAAAPSLSPRALDPAMAAVVVHTSGSTGQPQAIPKSLAQLAAEVGTLEQTFGARLGAADIVATVSHQHIYGLLFKVLWPLAAGRVIHAGRLAYPEQMAAQLGATDCVLVASPAHLKRLPAHLDWSAARSSLKAVFSSGGMLPEGAGIELGQAPIEVYGSSETGGIGWRQRGPAMWQPLAGVEWQVNPDGLLEVRSPHLPDRNWMTLADRAEAGEGGFVLHGRADRIVKIEEKRISLDAIEAALLASGLVREVRVLLVPAADGQRQSVAAFVVLDEAGQARLAIGGKHALNQQLRGLLAGQVEVLALPRRWRYLDRLPSNAQGKTSQASLLALLAPTLPAIKLLEKTAQRVLIELTVPSTLLYFDGHFHGCPVLPGVVQVDWAMHYGREHFDLPATFQGINALKFQQIIRADTPVQLELAYASDKLCLTFRYFSDAGPHAGGRIMFRH
jgi:acyl-coenzyme A synthetase/AMP-(fatty) acid ligase